MTSSIHAWIEVSGTSSVTGSRIHFAFAGPDLGGDNVFKALMAGDGRDLSVNEMKDFPSDVSSQCEEDATFRVNDEIAALGADGYCTRAKADDWVQRGISSYKRTDLVTDPDMYWPSWMGVKELEEVQRRYRLQEGTDYRPLEAVIAAMRVLDRDPDFPCRLVFWFRS